MVEQLNSIDEVNIAVSIVEDDAPARSMLADWIQRASGFPLRWQVWQRRGRCGRSARRKSRQWF